MSLANSLKVFIVLIIFKINYIYASGQMYTSDANNQYYIEFEEKFNWMESQGVCLKMNMTLVEIDNSDKSLELSALIQHVRKENKFKNVTLWIGGIMSRFPEKHFVWLTTGKKFNYTNWYGGNPNFVGKNEFCAQIVMKENMKWNDNRCLNKFGFVCEQNKIQQLEEKQKQWQQEIQTIKESLQHETQTHEQMQQNLEQEVEQKEKQLQIEMEKREKLEEQLQIESRKSADLQEVLQKELDLQQQLQDKLQQLRENKLKRQEKIEQNIQKELQAQENLRQELEIQKELNEQLREQLQELKDSISNMPKMYEENIKKELKEQERLRKEIKTPQQLQQLFQEQLKQLNLYKDLEKK
ncbi:lectin subunit alpha-like [Lucilia sericata]|uniref:lectin subunit alpha-like n=1 Tax=Lucilia sericata TaxID=13632 RepID=UPI0018A840A8|nr:lectin subunit alpha-like [Lucilia sericata]